MRWRLEGRQFVFGGWSGDLGGGVVGGELVAREMQEGRRHALGVFRI
jgi:hypothetical protein